MCFGWMSLEESAHQIQSCLKSHLEMPSFLRGISSTISKIEASFWNISLFFLTEISQILHPLNLYHLKVLHSGPADTADSGRSTPQHVRIASSKDQRRTILGARSPSQQQKSREIWKFYAPSKCHHSVGPWQWHLVIVWSPPVAATWKNQVPRISSPPNCPNLES